MRRHEQVECGGKEPMFQCPYCPYRAKQKGNLGVHIRKHHNLSEHVKNKSETTHFKRQLIPMESYRSLDSIDDVFSKTKQAEDEVYGRVETVEEYKKDQMESLANSQFAAESFLMARLTQRDKPFQVPSTKSDAENVQ